MPADQVLRGGIVVTEEGLLSADVAIEDGRIHAVGPDLPGASVEVDARDLTIFPGLIDVHVHFNEPGRSDWEGAATGSRGLAAGGGTVFFDMPLNSTPCTVNAREFDRKREALSHASITDFGLWGGLTDMESVGEMEELAARGVVGFKAFMCDSGLPEFPRADDWTLYVGLRQASYLGLTVAVHAENQEITQALSPLTNYVSFDDCGVILTLLRSRPVLAEVEAIHRACVLAREANARVHIVHISSGSGVVAALEARARGTDVTIETCAHYLYFTEEDVERLGAIAKCAPPLRNQSEQDALWAQLRSGNIDIVASDHSPAPPELKLTEDFGKAWGGIAGVQSTLAVLLDRSLPLERIASVTAGEPARRFRLAGKGAIIPGNDADLTLVDLSASQILRRDDLHTRHRLSPYIGRTFRGAVRRTIRRGETIFENGKITAQTSGKLVRPSTK